jgi:DNA modification methylase
MDIERISIARINPAPYNPRKDLQPGDPEYEKLKRSIETFGCVEPLVWNKRTGNLVGGHQRFKILLARGDKTADVSVVDLASGKEKALNIALNKISGEWDNQKLAELLDELVKTPNFDVQLTGFDNIEVEALLAEVLDSSDKTEDFNVDEALDRSKPAVTKAGEVIELGRHRIICGDSSKPETYAALLKKRSVDLIHCDPPYNVAYLGGERPIPETARPKKSRQWQRIYNDNLTQEEYSAWLATILGHACTHLSAGGCFYIWNGHKQFGPMYLILEEIGLKVSCVITWAKESFAIGYGDYNQQTEFCLYGWRENNGAHQWHGPTNESTLWQIRRDPTKEYQHPTQKPLEIAERAIRNSTRAGQTVLDMFLGSGTTLIAAERIGRKCVGVEIDAHYCDVVVRRYIAFVGEHAVPPQMAKRYRAKARKKVAA